MKKKYSKPLHESGNTEAKKHLESLIKKNDFATIKKELYRFNAPTIREALSDSDLSSADQNICEFLYQHLEDFDTTEEQEIEPSNQQDDTIRNMAIEIVSNPQGDLETLTHIADQLDDSFLQDLADLAETFGNESALKMLQQLIKDSRDLEQKATADTAVNIPNQPNQLDQYYHQFANHIVEQPNGDTQILHTLVIGENNEFVNGLIVKSLISGNDTARNLLDSIITMRQTFDTDFESEQIKNYTGLYYDILSNREAESDSIQETIAHTTDDFCDKIQLQIRSQKFSNATAIDIVDRAIDQRKKNAVITSFINPLKIADQKNDEDFYLNASSHIGDTNIFTIASDHNLENLLTWVVHRNENSLNEDTLRLIAACAVQHGNFNMFKFAMQDCLNKVLTNSLATESSQLDTSTRVEKIFGHDTSQAYLGLMPQIIGEYLDANGEEKTQMPQIAEFCMTNYPNLFSQNDHMGNSAIMVAALAGNSKMLRNLLEKHDSFKIDPAQKNQTIWECVAGGFLDNTQLQSNPVLFRQILERKVECAEILNEFGILASTESRDQLAAKVNNMENLTTRVSALITTKPSSSNNKRSSSFDDGNNRSTKLKSDSHNFEKL